jgi:hypothetical protein
LVATLHIVRFKLLPTAAEKDFLATNQEFQAQAKAILPGLERREAVRGADGEWALLLRYRDPASAQAQGAPSEVGKRLMGMIDKATLKSTFYEVVSE